MAYRTLAEILANNEQNDLILPGLVQKYLTTNEYLAWANTVITDKPTIIVNYVADYGAVQKGIDCNTSLTSASISGGSDSFSLVKYLRQYETCQDVVGLGSSFVDQAGEDLLGAVKAMTNELAIDAITGTSGEIVGLNSLVTSSVAASGVGGVGDIESIWYLFDAVKAKSDKMALIMNAKTKRAVMSALLAAASVQTTELKGTSFLVPVFNGAAILTNDSCSDGDVFLVNGGTDEGVFPVIGTYPGANIGNLFKLTDVGVNQSKDTRIFRIAGHFAHVRKSRDALARITGWIA
jgi:hypothetical protein